MKRPKDAPQVIQFEGIGPCYWKHESFRKPLKGEYFLSGAVVEAYQAYFDMIVVRHVVIPTYRARSKHEWTQGPKVTKADREL